MENRAYALATGVFLLLLGAAMAAAIVWFRGDHVQRLSYTLVTHAGVAGLAVKAAVRLRGVAVGSVESIEFDPTDSRRILVRLAIDRDAPITRSTYAQLGYQGVTGLSFIDLSDTGDNPELLAALPDSERVLPLKPSLIDQLATGGPALLVAVTQATERVNALLAPENQKRVERLLDSSERAMDRVAQRAEELQPTIRAMAPAIRSFDNVATRSDATLQSMEAAAEQAKLLAAELRGRLPVLDRAGDAAGRVESAARSIELGLVGADAAASPPLADSLGRAARAVDRASMQWSEQPQSLIFGRTPPPPGPGEAGFDSNTVGIR